MKSQIKVRNLLINLINSWPAKDYFFYKGWILRFTNGVTYRANSVIPINYYGNKKTIALDIKVVESAYQTYSLPPIFMMHDFYKPKSLKKELIKMDYRAFDCTMGMGCTFKDLRITSLNKDYEYSVKNKRSIEFSDFLAKNSSRSEEEQTILNQIAHRINIPRKCFITAEINKEVIGTIMGVLDINGYLYLADMFVNPEYRNQNIATTLIYKIINEWVSPINIKMLWLQVERSNNQAIQLYKKMGLKQIYNYYYMKKEV